MRKFALAGIGVFLILLIVRAPAGLIRWVQPDNGPLDMLDHRGTIWNGEATLMLDGVSAGRLYWDLRPVTLLNGRLGYDVMLSGSELSLSGTLQAAPGAVTLSGSGEINAAFLNQWLSQYDISLSGQFQLDGASLTTSDGRLTEAGGSARWSGGLVQFILSGKLSNSTLPALTAALGPGPSATVLPDGGQIPVITAELLENGFARVGVTKYMTKLLGNPWPGGDPDHAVVLEVEEQLF